MVDNSSIEIWMVGSDSYLDNQGWRIKTKSMLYTYKPIPSAFFNNSTADYNTATASQKAIGRRVLHNSIISNCLLRKEFLR